MYSVVGVAPDPDGSRHSGLSGIRSCHCEARCPAPKQSPSPASPPLIPPTVETLGYSIAAPLKGRSIVNFIGPPQCLPGAPQIAMGMYQYLNLPALSHRDPFGAVTPLVKGGAAGWPGLLASRVNSFGQIICFLLRLCVSAGGPTFSAWPPLRTFLSG